MSHMVIFRSGEGKVGYHQAETLEEAARFVERLRNHEGVEQTRIFRLEEVAFEFRPYYRVEVPSGGDVTEVVEDLADSSPEPVAGSGGDGGDGSDLEAAGAGSRRRFGAGRL